MLGGGPRGHSMVWGDSRWVIRREWMYEASVLPRVGLGLSSRAAHKVARRGQRAGRSFLFVGGLRAAGEPTGTVCG
jgi:hypothetical protein